MKCVLPPTLSSIRIPMFTRLVVTVTVETNKSIIKSRFAFYHTSGFDFFVMNRSIVIAAGR